MRLERLTVTRRGGREAEGQLSEGSPGKQDSSMWNVECGMGECGIKEGGGRGWNRERRGKAGEVKQWEPHSRVRRAENFVDKTKGLLYKRPSSTVGNRYKEGGTAMRRLVTLMLALGLLLGVAGSALAECGGSHTDTATPTTQKPLPQS